MLASWEMKQERKAARYPKISKMEVIWGLNNIHSVLSIYDPLLPGNSDADKEQASKLVELDWHTVNSSKGGICISQLREIIQDVDVGMLVAIRQSINEEVSDKWNLGIICWLTGNKRNGTQLGIKYIKGDIQAVKLQARKGNKIDTRFQTALMVSGQKIEGLNTPTLLTATGLYIESRPMVLQVGEEEQFIHARMKVSSSGSVDRFFYQPDNQIESDITDTNEDGGSDQTDSEGGEEIVLSAVPEAPVKGELNQSKTRAKSKKQNKVVTLDDMIVSKNK